MKEKNDILLSVKDLRTHFYSDDGVVPAVDGVSFGIHKGETFALVGESGCGKSVTSFSILKLLQYPPAFHPTGEIVYDGQKILDVDAKGVDHGYKEREMRKLRGSGIGMIFQEPMTSLNPVYTCGQQIVEAIRLHKPVGNREASRIAVSLLDQVGIDRPEMRMKSYPHQLSGGMRQRVMIAMALSCDPELLIADEPTTALDVTIQAQILELLKDLQKKRDLAILLITHDLAVVAETADNVAVMYASKIVEKANVHELYRNPLHPYTTGLFKAVPRLGEKKEWLDSIEGSVPNPLNFPDGCNFQPRCESSCYECVTDVPELEEMSPGHWAACYNPNTK